MVLPFWYLLEEALLDAEYVGDPQGELWSMAKMIYLELVKVLKRKVTWPADTSGWAKGVCFGPELECLVLMADVGW
jgi:hypothetical protein